MEDPEQALQLYLKRMKIEEHFRDLKNLLQLDRLMNKSRHDMVKLVAMVCIAFAIGLLVGEKLRDPANRGRREKMGKLLGAIRAVQGEVRLSEAEVAQIYRLAFVFFSEILPGAPGSP